MPHEVAIYRNSVFETGKRALMYLWDMFLWGFSIHLEIFVCSGGFAADIECGTLRVLVHGVLFVTGIVMLDNAVMLPVQLCQYTFFNPDYDK